jgi:hypothetical protein
VMQGVETVLFFGEWMREKSEYGEGGWKKEKHTVLIPFARPPQLSPQFPGPKGKNPGRKWALNDGCIKVGSKHDVMTYTV